MAGLRGRELRRRERRGTGAGSMQEPGKDGGGPGSGRAGLRVSVHNQSALSTSARLAWLFVSALGVSYLACAWTLCAVAPVDDAQWAAFNAEVPSGVFTWQLAGFGGVLVLNVINLVFCSSPVQYNCNVLLVLIHGVAFATDWLIHAQATPLVTSWGGHRFIPLRYVQWVHTTPTMILLMSMMSDLPPSTVASAVAADLVMVVTGLGASWTNGPLQLALLGVSSGMFWLVMRVVVDIFRGAMDEASGDPTSRLLLGRMLALTLAVWTLFPAVWVAAYGGMLSMATEQARTRRRAREGCSARRLPPHRGSRRPRARRARRGRRGQVLWGVSDYGAKVVFSSHLWQKNLATVAQRREAAQELMGALDRGLLLERVRSLLAAKERLVYALSHELRAPINGMLALVQELLHNKSQSSASRTKMLLMIRSSATCLLNTISTTLSGSAQPSAQLGPLGVRRLHRVRLWRVTEHVLRLARPLVKDHVRLINGVPRNMPPVKGDSMRLMQVLMNLVATSLKFTHAGDIRVTASAADEAATVTVADTGSGIPPEQLATALDPFEPGGEETRDAWEVCRSGLGLYLVQQALAGMGSSISASSEVGRGSSFVFELPLADSDCESESEADTDVFSEAGSLRASLELADLDGTAWRGGPGGSLLAASESAASVSSRGRNSMDLLAPPGQGAAAPPQSSLPGGASGANTAGSSALELGGQELQAPTTAGGGAARAAPGQAVAGGGNDPSSGTEPAAGAEPGGADGALGGPCGGAGLGPPKPSHRSVRGGRIQVLSVDDDPVNQLVAGTALRSHKWEVVKCMSGGEALEYLSSGCDVMPDLVLLDVMMPSMSGYEVAARIRATYPSSLLPIIMVSAKTEEEDIVQGLRCGADDYITKPFKRAELAARIRAHIRARDAFAEAQAVEAAWQLAHNLLPPNVQRKLRAGETVIAESHPAASVLWAEVVGGAAPSPGAAREEQHAAPPRPGAAPGAAGGAAANGAALVALGGGPGPGGVGGGLTPAEAVVTLNSLYTTWEELCAREEVLGVDFSGSTFVVVSGHDDDPGHLLKVLATAEAMLRAAAGMRQADGSALAVRLGLASGPLTTGLVGSKVVKLVLMGDTVEVARALAASGSTLGLHISGAVHAALGPAAAAAMPWTLQALPGCAARAHTYLLPLGGGAGGVPARGADQVARLDTGQRQRQGSGSELAGPSSADGSVGRAPRFVPAPGSCGTPGSGQAAAAGLVSAALPAPAPGGSVGFGRSSVSSRPGSARASRDVRPQAGSGGAAAAANGAAAAGAEGVAEDWLLVSPARAAAAARDPAHMVSAAPPCRALTPPTRAAPPQSDSTQLRGACSNSGSPVVTRHQLAALPAAVARAAAAAAGGAGGQDADGAQSAASALLAQLGTERQQLQQALLERTQAAAASQAELGCVRAQLGEARAAAASHAGTVEALRSQLGAALMRAHLADCWRALATMRGQMSSLSAALPGSLAGPPQTLALLGAPAGRASGSSVGGSLAGGSLAGGDAAGASPLPGLDAPPGGGAASVVGASSVGGAPGSPGAAQPALAQLLAQQSAQLTALQQQQLLLLAGLQQQGAGLGSQAWPGSAGGLQPAGSATGPEQLPAARASGAGSAGRAGGAAG
ncbi:walR [Scenedesmus sp. PABB004]|nr:walR [Scenedesmus sp. PABB004]